MCCATFPALGAHLKKYVPLAGIYPAGRLDRDSEGLLLLTDDGALQHRLTYPRFEHPRTYWVQVEGLPTEEALRRLASGATIQDYRTRPAKVRRLGEEETERLPPRDPPIRFRKTVPASWIEITLTEGRNRQVRRMTAQSATQHCAWFVLPSESYGSERCCPVDGGS